MGRITKYNPDLWFVTSDLHFWHNNIIRYCDRRDPATGEQFTSVERMHEVMIENLKSKIPDNGHLFIIGDLAMGGSSRQAAVESFLAEIPGTPHLISGNHDTYMLGSSAVVQEGPYLEVMVGSQMVVMCHYPMVVWNNNHRGAWMLHGHCHHNLPVDTRVKRIDVGIDGAGYGFNALSFAEVAGIMSAHGQAALDHHGDY